MILVDANLLIYAHNERSVHHRRSREWLDGSINSGLRVGMPWPSLLAFFRLITNPRIFEPARTNLQAWGQIQSWLSCENVWIPSPTERHAEVLGSLLHKNGIQANLIQDAHLATLALEHGLTLYSNGTDFARFPGLRWHNPLA